MPPDAVATMFGNRVAVSPIVTVEPRRRKFHKPITLTIPLPRPAQKGMLNQYDKETPSLRLLCSITGTHPSNPSHPPLPCKLHCNEPHLKHLPYTTS